MTVAWQPNENFIQTLTDLVPGMLGYWNRALVCTFANGAYLACLEKTSHELMGLPLQDVRGANLLRADEPFVRAALLGQFQVFERSHTLPSGELRVTLAHFMPHRVGTEVLGVFVLFLDITERTRLEQALLAAADEHQLSIGHELHDNLGQQIAAIAYQSKALENKLAATGQAEFVKIATSIAQQAQSAVAHCSQIARGALSFELEANGLAAALQLFATHISQTYEISCAFVGHDADCIDTAELALNLYRMAQEATHNAIRHGGARHLTIALSVRQEVLSLSISDDGCGFAAASALAGKVPGMGIKIMHYRARKLGASLQFLPGAQGGAQVLIKLPMNALGG